METYNGSKEIYNALKDGKKLCKVNPNKMPLFYTARGFYKVRYYFMTPRRRMLVRLENGEIYDDRMNIQDMEEEDWYEYPGDEQLIDLTIPEIEEKLGFSIRIIGKWKKDF